MSTMIRRTSSEEILQPSALRTYPWPALDPVLASQRTRTVTANDVELVRLCANSVAFDLDQLHRNTAGLTLSARIAYLLAHQKINFNPTGAVRQEALWEERIANAVHREEAIDITYPLMCVQGNWAKRMTNTGPHAGEDCTLLFFSHLNEIVRQIYAPGVRFQLFCDARLYNSAFQISEVEVTHYMRSLSRRVHELGITGTIAIHDYTEALEEYAFPEYMQRYLHFHCELTRGNSAVLHGVNIDGLYESVRASVNTRRLGMSYADHHSVFGPTNERGRSASAFNEVVSEMTDIAFREVVATRKACADVDVLSRMFPNAVRVTCHKGPKNGVWHIGLRCFPEYYGASKLLPYHGVPLIHLGKSGLPRLEIHPEICLRGDSRFIRVLKPAPNDNDVYFYDATHLAPNTALLASKPLNDQSMCAATVTQETM